MDVKRKTGSTMRATWIKSSEERRITLRVQLVQGRRQGGAVKRKKHTVTQKEKETREVDLADQKTQDGQGKVVY